LSIGRLNAEALTEMYFQTGTNLVIEQENQM